MAKPSVRAWLWGLTAAACCAATLVVPAESSAATRKCKQVGFEQHSDNVATHIRARNLGCRRARQVVRAVYGENFSPFGYRCRSREVVPRGLQYTAWRCRKRSALVTWRKY